jgi:hypothetical protein
VCDLLDPLAVVRRVGRLKETAGRDLGHVDQGYGSGRFSTWGGTGGMHCRLRPGVSEPAAGWMFATAPPESHCVRRMGGNRSR